MSGFITRIVDTQETTVVAFSYREVSQDTVKTIMGVEKVNEDMMNHWIGEGGNSFERLASTIEFRLLNCCRFYSNSSEALDDMVANFQMEDEVRGSSIETKIESGGESDG